MSHRDLAAIDLVVGRQWRAHLALLRACEHRELDLEAVVVDTVDLLLDSDNLTRDVAADRVLTLLHDLLTAVHELGEHGDAVHKVVVAFPDEPWELVLARPHAGACTLSLVGLGPGARVVARDRPISLAQLGRVAADTTTALLDELTSLAPAVEHDDIVERLRALAATVVDCDPGASVAEPDPPTPAPVRIEVACDPARLRLRFEGADRALATYRGTPAFDTHALLVAGRLEVATSQATLVLHDGDGVLLELHGWLERLERRLRGARSAPAELAVRLTQTGQQLTLQGGDARVSLEIGTLAEAFARLVEAVEEALLARNPLLAVNQRLQAMLDAGHGLAARRRDQVRGDRFGAAPVPVASAVAAAPATDGVTFPHPVTASSLRRLRYHPRWTVTVDGLRDDSLHVTDALIVVSGAEHVVAIERRDGSVRWRAETGAAPWIERVGADDLLVADEDELRVLSLSEGSTRWRLQWAGPVAPWPSRPVMVVQGCDPRMAVLAGTRGCLTAVDLDAGAIRWQQRAEDLSEWSAVAAAGPIVCLATEDGAVEALEASTGMRPWRLTNRSAPAALRALDAGLLAVWEDASGDDALCVELFDTRTGRGRWQTRVPDAVELVALEVVGEVAVLVVEDASRALWWLGLSVRGGRALWRDSGPFDAGGSLPLAWVGAEDALFVLSDGGAVARLSPDDGEVVWCQPVWIAGGDEDRGALHLVDGVLLASQESSVLVAPSSGEVLCRVDGLPADVRRVEPIEGFELVTIGTAADDVDDAGDALGLFAAGGFLGVVK